MVPPGTDLASLDGSRWARGLMSTAIGSGPPAQTMLDIGQGARVTARTYDQPLPAFRSGPLSRFLGEAASRARSAPREIRVGALREALDAAAVRVVLPRDRLARTAFLRPQSGSDSPNGSDSETRTTGGSHGELRVITAERPRLDALRSKLGPEDTLIALERPHGEPFSDIALAGHGFTREAVSSSTHLVPLVSSVDVAPTILDRLGIPIPPAMEGTAITGGHHQSFGTIPEVEARLVELPAQRNRLVLAAAAVIAALFLIGGLLHRRSGIGTAASLAAAAMPLALVPVLVVPRLSSNPTIETAMIVALAIAGAWGLRRLAGDLNAYAIACGLALATVAIDLSGGFDLIPFSVLGPGPASGIRFFGVGNQLEAILACCLFLGLSAWATARLAGFHRHVGTHGHGGRDARHGPHGHLGLPGDVGPGDPVTRRRLALIFCAGAAISMVFLVPGQLGADVGAVITMGAGAAAACLILLDRNWKVIAAMVLAVPLLLAIFALLDVVTGAGSHFTRTIVGAASPGEAIGSLLSRVEASARTVTSPFYRPYLALVATGVVALGVITWRLDNPLRRPWLQVGVVAAAAALVGGAAGNDSGVRLIIAGAPFLLAWWGMALTLDPAPGGDRPTNRDGAPERDPVPRQ